MMAQNIVEQDFDGEVAFGKNIFTVLRSLGGENYVLCCELGISFEEMVSLSNTYIDKETLKNYLESLTSSTSP